MKIALSGAGGTGKTTLATAISKKLGIPMIPEFARETAAEMGITNLRDMPPGRTYEFQCRIMERKLAEEDKHPTFIADRSMADNLAYYLRWCSREVDDDLNKKYVDRCKERLRCYDRIIVLPQVIPLENDGFRSSNIYYQYQIQCLVIGILVDNNIGWTCLSEPDLEKRILIIQSFFEDPICQIQK